LTVLQLYNGFAPFLVLTCCQIWTKPFTIYYYNQQEPSG